MGLTMRTSLLVALAALAAGCAHSAPAPRTGPAAVGAYYPLAIGNQWDWEDQSPQLPAGAPSLRTVRITERTADGYWRDTGRGELKVGACLQDRQRSLLCGPIAVGTSWSSVLSVSSIERYEIVGVGEAVETPAGRFTGCVRVRSNTRAAAGTELINEITYAPGVGPVRIEVMTVAKGVAAPQLRALLRGYRVGGK
jgi:hypothetical protein